MSGGYVYGEAEPKEPCPYCKTECEADFVDIGVGFQQCGPYHCTKCGASEIGPNDDERPLTPQEKKLGWYEPGAEPGSSANVVNGGIVDHNTMKALYQNAYIKQAAAERSTTGIVETILSTKGEGVEVAPINWDEWWDKIRKK